MPQKRTTRIYWKHGRAYADFRDFADVGGKLLPLIPPGRKYATTEPDEAAVLVADLLRRFESARRAPALALPIAATPTRSAPPMVPPAPGVGGVTLGAYAAHYLTTRQQEGQVTEGHLRNQEQQLHRALAYFGAGRPLASLTTPDVLGYLHHLRTVRSQRGKPFKADAIRAHIFSLSGLYTMAAEEGLALNPVRVRRGRLPTPPRGEQVWLDYNDAVTFLEACQTIKLRRGDLALKFLTQLVATLLLTGGRPAEVYGLEEQDIDFRNQVVRFRPNSWRSLKNDGSRRVVPLWPQLRDILRPYLNDRERRRLAGEVIPSLLFPSRSGGLLVNCTKALRQVEAYLGWPQARKQGGPGHLTPKAFRHTYCATRLQTTERGMPVSDYQVGLELGQNGPSMVRQVYGHLGRQAPRWDQVLYSREGCQTPSFVTEFVTGEGL